MARRVVGVAFVVAAVILVAAAGTAAAQGAADAPPDPDEDVIGWENGYWYNESIDVDPSDGLNDSELDRVVARSMARVEEIRRLEFEESVPVEIITREEYRGQTRTRYANVTPEDRLHQNVKYEAVFMVNESTGAVEVLRENRGASVLGYYDFGRDRIVIVSDNPDTPEMNEITLAQELFHALQDQHFDLSQYNRTTTEEANAVNGIVEGDGNYVDFLYQERCDAGTWGDCLLPEGGQTGGQLANVGIYLINIQPYSDGPPFVKYIRDRGGWEAVNALYEDPPASTEQVIHPEKYNTDPPTEVTVQDTSSGEWRVLDLPGGIDYAEFGEAGIFSMFIYPSIVSQQRTEIVPLRGFVNRGSDLDIYRYTSPYSAGWDGDRLLPYVTNDSVETGETGYVWKSVWDSPSEAREFRRGYRQLLDYHDAERVAPDTYEIPDDRGFGDAIHVDVRGSTVTIVNAPTVADLDSIRSGIDTATPDPPTDGGSGDVGGDGTPDPGDGGGTPTVADDTPITDDDPAGGDPPTRTATAPGTTATPGQAGFGAIAAVLALLVALRRRA